MSFASSMKYAGLCLAAALTLSVAPLAGAQVSDASVVVTVPAAGAKPVITAKVDESKLAALPSPVLPAMKNAKDLGRASADMKMSLQLELRRSFEQEQALKLLNQQALQPGSPMYKKTFTPVEFAETFGLAKSDLDTLKSALQSAGFTVGNVDNGRMTIDFEGNVAQVEAAFHTEIHNYTGADGAQHYAPVGDLQIPKALLPAIARVKGLQNFTAMERLGFNGPVVDFAAAGEKVQTEAGKLVTPKLDGEGLHDSSFTASKYVLGLSEKSTTLNVRIGGNSQPVTGSLSLVDLNGKVVGNIKDITSCSPYGTYGRSCTADFAPPVGTSFLHVVYSGDETNRGASIGNVIISRVGTSTSYVAESNTPLTLSTTATPSTVYVVTSWVGTAQATGSVSVVYYNSSTVIGGATFPASGSTSSSGSGTGNTGTYTYICTASTALQTVSCTITIPSLYSHGASAIYGITSTYSGDANYASSLQSTADFYNSSATAPTITTTTSITSAAPTGGVYGGGSIAESMSVTLTATSGSGKFSGSTTYPSLIEITGLGNQVGTPATYTFSGGTSGATSASLTGLTWSTPALLDAGTYPISAAFSGNSAVAGDLLKGSISTSQNLVITQQTPTFGTMVVAPNSVGLGVNQAVTLTDSLNFTGIGNAPTGAVTFTLNSVAYPATCTIGTNTESCTATVPGGTIAGLGAATYPVTVAYTADTNYAAATGTAGSLVVSSYAVGVTATNNPQTYGSGTTLGTGSSVTLTANISVASSGAVPTGTVTFTLSAGVTTIGSVNLTSCTPTVSGSETTYACNYTWTPPATSSGDNAGTYTVTGAYSGDSNYAAKSGTVAYIINKDGTSTVVTTTPQYINSGSPSIVIKTVTTWNTPGNGVSPTGTMTITCGTGSAGACTGLPAALTFGSSSCPITVATHSVTCTFASYNLYSGTQYYGVYNITGTYSGDPNYGTSVGVDPVDETENVATTTTASVTSGSPAAYGTSATVNFKVIVTSATNDGSPTGTLTLTNPTLGTLASIQTSTCSISNQTATCTIPYTVPAATAVGSYTVTATYNPTSIYYNGSSGTTSFSVSQAATTLTLSAGTAGTSTAPVTGTTLTAVTNVQIAGITVTFTDAANGFQTTAVTDSTGTATTPTITGTTAGLNNITASITGTSNYTAATSNTVPVYIGGILYTTTGFHNFSTDPGTTDGTKLGPYGVTVYNFTSSAQPLTFSFTNAASGAFSYVTNCPSTLAALASCAVQFYYAPPFGDGNSTTVGEFESASWNIAPNAGVLTGIGDSGFDRSGATTLPGTLAGKALLATASLSVSPLSYSFGSQAAGTTSNTESIVVTNNFGTPVAFTYTGPTTSEFTASSNCVSPLAGNSTCKINVTFSGSTPATYNDSIVITPSGGSAITSSMTGTIASNSGLTISSTSHSFGNVTDGTTATFGFSITNNSGASATVGVSYPTATGYTVSTNCGTTLAAAAVCNVNVTFAPTTVATLTDTITVSSSVPVLPGGTGSGPYSDVVSVTGNGVAGGSFTASSVNHNFGNVPVGTSAGIYGVELSNNTSSTVTLSLGAGFTNGANGFTIVATNCGSTLAVNANCELQFSFEPTATGAVTASYGISPNVTSGGSTYSAITLSGNGQ